MKKILLSMFLLGTLLSANAQVPSYVPSNGLIGWWPFSGNANDQSGNGNNGAVNGATLSNDRFTTSNSAYSFNGTSNFISVTHNSSLNVFPLTISVWFKTSSSVLTSMLVTKYACQSQSGFSSHLINEKPSGYYFSDNSNFVNSDGSTIGLTPLNDNLWHNSIMVFNTDSLKCYIDGKFIYSKSYTGTPFKTTTTENLYFGRYPIGICNPNSNNYYFDGLIDDIGIWNRAITSSEIKDLYNGCKLSVSTEPTNQSSNIYAQAQFNVIFNDTASSYQWQSNQSNLGWVNIPSSSFYSGVTSKKLTVNNIQLNNHKQLFRVIATKNTCKDTSVVAMLTVNDTCITSTTDTLYIKVNTSSLSNPVYNIVKVYPNPSSTQVIVDNGNFSTMGSYTAKIVNSIGQQVFQSVINQQQFVIDAKTMGGAGVYTLYITDANNKVVGVKKIVLQ